MLGRVECVSVAVSNLEEAVRTYRDGLGFTVGGVRHSKRGSNLRWVELGDGDSPTIELLEPTGEGPVQRFLDRAGEGIYQARFLLSDLNQTVEELEAHGIRVVRDVSGIEDSERIAWIHPASTRGVLFELVERTHQQDARSR